MHGYRWGAPEIGGQDQGHEQEADEQGHRERHKPLDDAVIGGVYDLLAGLLVGVHAARPILRQSARLHLGQTFGNSTRRRNHIHPHREHVSGFSFIMRQIYTYTYR